MPYVNGNEKDKTIQLGKNVLHQDDLKISVEYNGEVFTLRYPSPIQRAGIENEIARRLGGLPRESYDIDSLTLIIMSAYVENLYIPDECPDWFKGAWNCYDDELIANLYTGYLRFRDEFRNRVKQGKFSGAGETGGT